MASERRFEALDSVRGIAALCVFLFHSRFNSPICNNLLISNSYLFVDFFFVLSGFVISHSYFKRFKNMAECKEFILRRFLRLYPLHLFTLFLFLGIEIAKYFFEKRSGIISNVPAFSTNNAVTFFTNLLMINSLNLHPYLTYNRPSWSIGVEFYTYIFFALLCFSLKKISENLKYFVFVLIALGSFAWLMFVSAVLDVSYDYGFIRCTAGFFLGVFANRTYEIIMLKNQSHKLSWLANIMSVIIVIALLQTAIRPIDYYMPILFFIMIVSIATNADTFACRILCLPVLKWLGARSYSIYMMHAFVIWVTNQILRFVFKFPIVLESDGRSYVTTGKWEGTIIVIIATIVLLTLSNLTYRNIEMRFLYKKCNDNKHSKNALKAA